MIRYFNILLAITCMSQAAVAQDVANDIVVNGRRKPSPQPYIDNLGNAVRYTPTGVEFPGTTGNVVRDQHTCLEKRAKQEAGSDETAKDYEGSLAGTPDANEREYAQFIIMDAANSSNPTFRGGTLVRGETWAEARAAGRDVPQVSLPLPTLSTFEYILGIVHNHPPVGDPNPTLNQMPSTNDFSVYKSLVNHASHPRVAPAYAFSNYIKGPDGKLRQYRQDKGMPTSSTTGIVNGC